MTVDLLIELSVAMDRVVEIASQFGLEISYHVACNHEPGLRDPVTGERQTRREIAICRGCQGFMGAHQLELPDAR